jgi:hypothetical protein
MATPESASRIIYGLKITLDDVAPPVWRRVEVEDCSLETLHEVIQDAMGWENYHLYEFEIDGVRYTDARAADSEDEAAHKMTLGQLVQRKQPLLQYVYDLGDNWNHSVEIEDALPADPAIHYPRCLEGKRACPPEDCGGPPGYDNLLAALKDPRHEEHDELLDWVGDEFDPEAFDPNEVNRGWARWIFSDPRSKPVEDEEELAPDVAKPPKGKPQPAKAQAKPKPEKKDARAGVGRNDPCPCGSGKKFKKCCFKKGKGGLFDDE